MTSRGLLLAFQGLDKTGKTTQCKLLHSHLQSLPLPTCLLHFPMRKSCTGLVLNEYLKNKLDLSPQVSHLLFSANRWQYHTFIQQQLSQNSIVILDRYIWSGRAYSYSLGLDEEWVDRSDEGLPLPDCIFFMRARKERGGIGNQERYETEGFQRKVQEKYQRIIRKNGEKNVVVVDAGRSLEENRGIIRQKVMEMIR